jgi:hypothetical protein
MRSIGRLQPFVMRVGAGRRDLMIHLRAAGGWGPMIGRPHVYYNVLSALLEGV